MACTPDPEDSWPLWSIATHELKSPDPRVPSEAGTRRDKAPRLPQQLPGPAELGKGVPAAPARGADGASKVQARTSSAQPDSWGGQSRAQHAERSGVLPSSAQALGSTQGSSAELRRMWAWFPLVLHHVWTGTTSLVCSCFFSGPE